MSKHIKLILQIISFGFILLLSACVQETLLFHDVKLSPKHKFSFTQPYEEHFITVADDVKLHGLLFKAKNNNNKVILYLHGNALNNDYWGHKAKIYLKNEYDFFMVDYRGFGKSSGRIKNEASLYQDIQLVYDFLKDKYGEKNLVLIGYSIGTGIATKIAAENKPKTLILLAPYYNMEDLVQSFFSFYPKFLVRYKFKTNEYITKVNVPIYIFHGLNDSIIYPDSAKKLQALLKPTDKVYFLNHQNHDNIDENYFYQKKLLQILQ